MEFQEFLSWLGMTELRQRENSELRSVFRSVLRAFPEEREVCELGESLLGAIEEQLEALEIDLSTVADWPQDYEELLPVTVDPLSAVEDRLEAIAESLSQEQLVTDRLLAFEQLVQVDEEAWDESLSEKLSAIESQISQAWSDYSGTEIRPHEVSAESVGGHQYLEAGFFNWFEAVDLLRAGESEEAWEAALEGNRLLMAVSIWSDSLRSETSTATIGEA